MERRRFLQCGGAALFGAVVLGACTSDDSGHQQGQPPTTTPTTLVNGAGPTDIALTKTAASLEAMLIDAYQKLTTSPLVTSSSLVALGTLFAQHHTQHLAALNGIITTGGSAAITAPNDVMEKQIVQPALAAAKTQDDLVHLFFTLEDATAQTYVYAGGASTRPDLRSSMMSIGGIEARHRALLSVQVEQQQIDDLFPSAFAQSDNPLPPDALVT
ncbi:MAG TPA: ferritin-like domain-containing protein [Acidimicrobiales bacterium]|jgi:hypothetical protein